MKLHYSIKFLVAAAASAAAMDKGRVPNLRSPTRASAAVQVGERTEGFSKARKRVSEQGAGDEREVGGGGTAGGGGGEEADDLVDARKRVSGQGARNAGGGHVKGESEHQPSSVFFEDRSGFEETAAGAPETHLRVKIEEIETKKPHYQQDVNVHKFVGEEFAVLGGKQIDVDEKIAKKVKKQAQDNVEKDEAGLGVRIKDQEEEEEEEEEFDKLRAVDYFFLSQEEGGDDSADDVLFVEGEERAPTNTGVAFTLPPPRGEDGSR